MPLQLKFAVLDVFTSTPFTGNQLAIVHVPHHDTLSQEQKQTTAKEFGFSETVFLYDLDNQDASSKAYTFNYHIFTPSVELPFAGHPTIGAAYYLTSGQAGIDIPKDSSLTLKARAGDVFVEQKEGGLVEVVVGAFDFKLHPPLHDATIKTAQTELKDEDFVNGIEGPEQIYSVVKGTSFFSLQVTSLDALNRMATYAVQPTPPEGFLGEYANKSANIAYVFAYYIDEKKSTETFKKIHARMFFDGIEDPATGSACVGLLPILTNKTSKAEIIQGEKMGRRSEIYTTMEVGEDGKIAKVTLAGNAVRTMEGTLTV